MCNVNTKLRELLSEYEPNSIMRQQITEAFILGQSKVIEELNYVPVQGSSGKESEEILETAVGEDTNG